MASTEQLERITAILESLLPLGGKGRGMPIQADEWNALVQAVRDVLEIDRAQEQLVETTLGTSFAPRGHQHLGEADIEWFGPDLQARLAEGAGPVATRTVLADALARADGLARQVARLTDVIESQQKQLDRSVTSEIERSSVLRGFEDRFATVTNLRGVVRSLEAQVGGLGTNLETVLELRGILSGPDGEPLDLNGLQASVRGLEGLRENLVGLDGELLRARELEARLVELEALDVSGPRLDERIATVVGRAEGRIRAEVDGRVGRLSEDVAGEQERVRADMAEVLASRVADVRAVLAQETIEGLAEAEGRIAAGVRATVNEATGGLREELATRAEAAIDVRLATVDARITERARAVADEMRDGLRAEVTAAVTERAEAQVSELRALVETRVGAVESRFETVGRDLRAEVDERVAAAASDLAGSLADDLGRRLQEATSLLADTVDRRVTPAVEQALRGVDDRIAGQVAAGLEGIDQRVGAEVTRALRDLPQAVAEEVNGQIAGLQLDSRFDRLRQEVVAQFRGDLDQVSSGLRASLSEAVAEQAARTSRDLGRLREDTGKAIAEMDQRVQKVERFERAEAERPERERPERERPEPVEREETVSRPPEREERVSQPPVREERTVVARPERTTRPQRDDEPAPGPGGDEPA